MTGNELTIGSFGVSVLLSIALRLIYNTIDVGNRAKPWIAISLGVGFGIIALFYYGQNPTFKMVVDYVLQGVMTGATSVGLYEISQKKS